MWNELARGAVGAIVVVDTRRLAESFPAIDFFEDLGVPFVVAVNCFDGKILHAPVDIREAVAVDPDVPVELFDARDRDSVKHVLTILVDRSLGLARSDLVAAGGSSR